MQRNNITKLKAHFSYCDSLLMKEVSVGVLFDFEGKINDKKRKKSIVEWYVWCTKLTSFNLYYEGVFDVRGWWSIFQVQIVN